MDPQIDPDRRNLNSYRKYEPSFKEHFAQSDVSGSYDEFAEAYRSGASLREDEPRSSWLEVRSKAMERWSATDATRPWSRVEPFIKFAFNRSKERVRDGSQGVDGR